MPAFPSAKRLPAIKLPLAIGLFGLCVIALLWGGLIFEARQERDVALSQARTDTANLVIAFREHVRRTFTAIDQVMLAIKAEFTADPDHYRLPNWLANSPFLSGMAIQVAIIGADGYLRESSLGDPPEGRLDLSDRAHFRYQLDPSAPQPFISRPVVGRGSGKMSIQISRRLERADGTFAGVLVFSLDPYYLSQFFETIDLGDQGVVALVGSDGIVRARRTRANTEIGQDLSAGRLFEHLAKADQGTFTSHARLDGRERIYSYGVVPDYPLIVTVGKEIDEVLAGARAAQKNDLLFGIGVSLVLLLLTGLLIHGTVLGRRREDAIAEQASLLQNILDVSPAAIWVKDASGRFELINEAMRRVLGRPRDKIIGHTSADMLPADAAEKVREWDDAALARSDLTVAGEHSFQRDGKLHRFLTFRRTCDIAGRWRVVGSAMDVTSLRCAEEALRSELQQREAAEAELRQAQKMEAIGKLTGGVAHDFNNLLTSVLGHIELAQRRVRDRTTRRLLENAERGARRGAQLIQHLLAFARKQRLQLEPIGLNGLILGMMELLEHTFGAAIRIETRLEDRLWPALADANQVEAAILNLAINARDAMPAGGQLTIQTANCGREGPGLPPEVSPGSDYVLMTMTDSGIGMAADVLARVFDPFFTTKDVGKGSGLGLSQVYGLARQSGGTVRIDSVVREGTTVRLYLPRAAEPAAESVAAEPETSVPLHADLNVLVVDDDEHVRGFAASCLADCGYHVIQAASGAEALDVLERTSIDIMVVDIVMPRMVGPELARRARQRHPDLPVLFMTGMANAQSLEHELGPAVQKPFRAARLIAEIDRLLDRGNERVAATARSA